MVLNHYLYSSGRVPEHMNLDLEDAFDSTAPVTTSATNGIDTYRIQIVQRALALYVELLQQVEESL